MDFLYHTAVLASLVCAFLVIGGALVALLMWGFDCFDFVWGDE